MCFVYSISLRITWIIFNIVNSVVLVSVLEVGCGFRVVDYRFIYIYFCTLVIWVILGFSSRKYGKRVNIEKKEAFFFVVSIVSLFIFEVR